MKLHRLLMVPAVTAAMVGVATLGSPAATASAGGFEECSHKQPHTTTWMLGHPQTFIVLHDRNWRHHSWQKPKTTTSTIKQTVNINIRGNNNQVNVTLNAQNAIGKNPVNFAVPIAANVKVKTVHYARAAAEAPRPLPIGKREDRAHVDADVSTGPSRASRAGIPQ